MLASCDKTSNYLSLHDWNRGVTKKEIVVSTIRQCLLTFGTNISSMLRKQQKITASDTKTNDASCCEACDAIDRETLNMENPIKNTHDNHGHRCSD